MPRARRKYLVLPLEQTLDLRGAVYYCRSQYLDLSSWTLTSFHQAFGLTKRCNLAFTLKHHVFGHGMNI